MHAVITTEHKGVFFGEIEPLKNDEIPDTIKITNAQMCVYWSEGGIVGLAATGPTAGCRITKPAPSITVNAVTAVMEASAEAVAAWSEQPWS